LKRTVGAGFIAARMIERVCIAFAGGDKPLPYEDL